MALDALKRFRALCDTLHVRADLGDRHRRLPRRPQRPRLHRRRPSASAARRSTILSGKREAHLTALGIISGIHKPDGIVGDLGGGSLELIDVHGTRVRRGLTLPLGGLALQDIAGKSIKKAEKFVEDVVRRPRHAGRRRGPHLLRGRRHLARAGAAAHVADRLSVPRHAQLPHLRARGAGILAAGASRRYRDAVARSRWSTPRAGRCSPMPRW